jgi:sodium-dependent dicarboxylate transporter 2/3/5
LPSFDWLVGEEEKNLLTGQTTPADPGSRLVVQRLGLWLGPALFLLQLYFQPLNLPAGGNEVVGISFWMLCWWITEAAPLPVTALLPVVLMPLTGVVTLDEALRPYSSKIVYLFFGGFMLALGLEAHGLHQRIALLIIRLVGFSPPRLILGFLLATALLSMWISNTATAVMMLPMALSVLALLTSGDEGGQGDPAPRKRFAAALILCIAYGANTGGMGTIIGTPPNLVMRGYFESQLGIEISFFTWMLWAIPVVLVILSLIYFLLTYLLFPCHDLQLPDAERVFAEQRRLLGPMRPVHWRMLAVFAVTAMLWMFGGLIRPLLPVLPLTGAPVPLTDEIVAIAAAIALFVVPGEGRQGDALLNWEATRRLPWGILLLFGGGLSLANGLEITGVIQTLSGQVEWMAGGQVIVLVVLLTALSLYLTELMSNVAMVQVMVPVVSAVAVGLGVNPLFLALPVTLASSCAFMLPMATPPNAIVFSTGQISVWQMIKAGFWLNLVSLVAILVISQTLVRFIS